MCEFSRFAPHAHPIAVQCFTMESRPVGKKLNEGVFCKKWKMGVYKSGKCFFCKKVENGGDVFFVKSGPLCTVSVFFCFTFYLFGGAYTPNAPPLPIS